MLHNLINYKYKSTSVITNALLVNLIYYTQSVWDVFKYTGLNYSLFTLDICRFIRFIRHSTTTDVHFFVSHMWAEMKKTVAYKVDISVSSLGVVQEAQCECAAGQGPSAHCKHVAAVLFGLMSFTTSGNLITALTCTQVTYFL